MIKEKDLTKTKFFTTNGTDIWKVRSASTFTLVELVNCETGGTASARVGERSAGGFVPIKMPKVKAKASRPMTARRDASQRVGNKKKTPSASKTNARPQEQKAKKVGISETKTPVTRTTGSGIPAGSKPSSQYLGVRAVKRGHYAKWLAQVNRGKFVHLGTFNIEEEAAAAVQEHLGNEEEATRLRTMARQKIQEKIEGTKGQTAWMCTKCGAGYEEKPKKCTHCGGGSFTRARPEGK